MAGFTLLFAPTSAVFGRSGYNKDGDEEGQNKGRSGYNKGDDDDEGQNKGRSGYNKGDDDDEGENKGPASPGAAMGLTLLPHAHQPTVVPPTPINGQRPLMAGIWGQAFLRSSFWNFEFVVRRRLCRAWTEE
ncbi:hypothetical protein F5X68DRAFT_232348 [Plectosphaerella plurivora]|uniref:Uncharacterized protein n=1 Tax=Plectosphaerella plurivora TaxID=936078 RepID=A0A9P8VBR1_9PEZI|nr:hypothetical protein F5X68DRAFT_232348 [Plectosphaerella plurivora]